jgi:phosphoribosylformylglycinamidine synthase
VSARVGVVTFPGSLDDGDAARAVRVAGGEAVRLWHGDSDLHGVDAVVIPGGFSYGDYLRVGSIARFSPAMESVIAFAGSGGHVLGICNGFQVLCEAGLLQGALLPNTGRRFLCRQVDVEVVNADSAFTSACQPGQLLSIPVKHTTGRYYAPDDVLDHMEAHAQILLRYADGHNPNGSERDIAGITNAAGNVMGLMPHPEHAVDPLLGPTGGAPILEGLVAAARERSESYVGS